MEVIFQNADGVGVMCHAVKLREPKPEVNIFF